MQFLGASRRTRHNTNLLWHYNAHLSKWSERSPVTAPRRNPVSILRWVVPEAPIPEGVEMQAQTLIHQAGSPALAKNAVDGVAEREAIPDFREDHFGRRFSFASRPELLAASTPLTAADGMPCWTTTIDGNRWIVWNQHDMSSSKTYSTLQEARSSVYPAIA